MAGLEIDNIITKADYSQLINKWNSSCINLIFSSDASFTRNYGIEQSVYEKCNHNITYGILDFNVPLPPPYYRENFQYDNADTEGNLTDWLIGLEYLGTRTQIKVVSYWRIH